jgi:hypothetical protein
MKTFILQMGIFAAMVAGLIAQSTLPTLPAVNVVSAAGVNCTFSVADNQMGISTECLADNGTILKRASDTPHVKGSLLGHGPILCLYWTDGLTPQTVRLQCSSDDDTGVGPKLVLDGKLAPVNKKRQWWMFWK